MQEDRRQSGHLLRVGRWRSSSSAKRWNLLEDMEAKFFDRNSICSGNEEVRALGLMLTPEPMVPRKIHHTVVQATSDSGQADVSQVAKNVGYAHFETLENRDSFTVLPTGA